MEDENKPRRVFLSRLSGAAMVGGLAAGYGAFFASAGRFLYPAKPTDRAWLYVAKLPDLLTKRALSFVLPGGANVTVAVGDDTGEELLALSSICPHLGCQVHWQADKSQFFCPCHNGTFDSAGAPTGGPPLKAGTPLLQYPVRTSGGLVFIEAPVQPAEGA